MAESKTPPPAAPIEEFRLIFSFLREDIQDLRQETRNINDRINDLAKARLALRPPHGYPHRRSRCHYRRH